MAVRFVQTQDRDAQGCASYEVWRDGQLLGSVERTASPSYRSWKGSRLRGSLIGYSRRWRPTVPREATAPGKWYENQVVKTISGGLYLSARALGERTRAEAVALLVAWADHPERREAA